MRTPKILIILAAVIMTRWVAAAQNFSILHTFDSSDGPAVSLVQGPDGRLYGATAGGTNGRGTLFALMTNGLGFTNLYRFTALVNNTNSDGNAANNGLIVSGSAIFGTTRMGGPAGAGTVFALDTSTAAFTNLHSFITLRSQSGEGWWPQAGLIVAGNILYGTTAYGGAAGNGTLFAIHKDGTGFTNIIDFTPNTTTGVNPDASLLLVGNLLYGTTPYGGSAGYGNLFAAKVDGTSLTNVYSFNLESVPQALYSASPYAGVVLSSNRLCGTLFYGGLSQNGSVYAINPDGTGFTNLYSFSDSGAPTNSDGANPQEPLILSGDTFYSTTATGGSNGIGTIFAVRTDGTGFTNLCSAANSPGSLVLSGNTLYGISQSDGTNGYGTIFFLTLPPPPAPIPLNVHLAATGVVLSWTNLAFVLQSAPVVGAGFTNVANAVSPYTNAITGSQRLFRLRAR